MNIKNCRSCGRIFNYVSGPFTCQVCREKLEVKFQEVKDFIRENPGVGIPEVAEACDVDSGQIRQWLREERLELTEDSPIQMTCESCGITIRSGRFCEKCKNGVANDLKDVLKEKQDSMKKAMPQENKTGAKMRYLK